MLDEVNGGDRFASKHDLYYGCKAGGQPGHDLHDCLASCSTANVRCTHGQPLPSSVSKLVVVVSLHDMRVAFKLSVLKVWDLEITISMASNMHIGGKH